ncbi:menaquinone biosynthetic enzyme MqnA/MqnD family protein [Desulfofundulus thermocisternus]|uniref:menaquinone biosynthetic enzyme MqnA/MqnD family protein n=1 Tax=Desulfofundulus thermocisternus TaxID=42471 RepID=UPI000481A2B3|nr:menaquinone biosynthesis protein [Desulfofundulus thermocisternus]
MTWLSLGQIEYLNCLPVYHALEEGLIPLNGELVKGPPTRLNRMFLEGALHCTPLSSIEYAKHAGDCFILPHLSIASDGRVASVLFFSHLPVTELEGKKICVTTASATSVVLLRILFEHYYHVEVEFHPVKADLKTMLEMGEGVLLIGDNAMQAHQQVIREGLPVFVTDLGQAWKDFTGEKMVYALWVIRREFAEAYPQEANAMAELLYSSLKIGMNNLPVLIKKAHRRTGLPPQVLEDYFHTIRYNFDDSYRRALLTFYDYAYKSGIIEERVKLFIWGEDTCQV